MSDLEQMLAHVGRLPIDALDSALFVQNVASRMFGEATSRVTLGRYTILRRVGEGGNGRVFEGFDPELERPVAIKVVRPEDDATMFSQQLRHEAQVLARL